VALSPNLDDSQPLGAGDRIAYQVIEDGDPPVSLTVSDAGKVNLPYYGPVTVERKTCRELARDVKALLEGSYYYQATVRVSILATQRLRGRVYLVGKVASPGPQDIPTDEVFTVGKAILSAGGFADFADQRKVKLIRKTAERTSVVAVDVSVIWEKGHTEEDPPVLPGDLIFVPTKLINF
jgi:protein involved in polysaccharide export with SLBB domain